MRSFARAVGATVFGAHAPLVDIQVAVYGTSQMGTPTFRIVGLPDSALREGRERIRSAVAHGGWPWPTQSLTVNLAPATARKEGAALDLPIALSILAAERVLPDRSVLRGCLALGELGLDGCVRSVRGVLAATEAARRRGIPCAIVPEANAAEAAAVEGMEVVGVGDLVQAVGHLSGECPLPPHPRAPWSPETPADGAPCLVRGQDVAVAAARIAAAGSHNLLLWGPPGAGKTLLSRQVAAWMPPLDYESALEVSRLHSVAGLLRGGLIRCRPFRAPHHTTSLAGLVGGGSIPHPGEVSLAHLGVLFLDELPEFTRTSLEALRQPLEEGRLVIGRAAGRATFPAEVLLVAALNPCPCGWKGVEGRCKCSAADVKRYTARVSGPLRDRFDLQVHVKAVDPEALVAEAPSPEVDVRAAKRLERARRAQVRRAARLSLRRSANARIPGSLLPRAVEPTRAAELGLVRQARKLGLTGRGVHRVLRVARTVADLAGSERVEEEHVRSALTYRGD